MRHVRRHAPLPPRFPLGVILSLAVVVPAPWSSAAAAEKREQEQKKPTPQPSSSPAPSYTDEDLKAARRTGKGFNAFWKGRTWREWRRTSPPRCCTG